MRKRSHGHSCDHVTAGFCDLVIIDCNYMKINMLCRFDSVLYLSVVTWSQL